MESSKFYTHVSSWIKSYRSVDALSWLRKFINNSGQPIDIRMKLHKEIDDKINSMGLKVKFIYKDGFPFFSENGEEIKVFTTRFSAVCKLAELKMKGLEVELVTGTVFFRIKLMQPQTISDSECDNKGRELEQYCINLLNKNN